MSRQRQANELAIEKTIAFLKDLKTCCELGETAFLSFDAENHSISKSTGSVCKRLAIIKPLGYSKYEWLKGEPDRQMALLILEKLRVRQQKTVDPEYLPNMQPLIVAVNALTEKITLSINHQNKAIREPKNASTLFSDQEQRQRDRIYIAGQIAGARYVSEQFTAIDACNAYVVLATDDLLNKLYSK